MKTKITWALAGALCLVALNFSVNEIMSVLPKKTPVVGEKLLGQIPQKTARPVPISRSLEDRRALAEKGDAKAQSNLGVRYAKGEDIAIYALCAIFAINGVFTCRFQRTTLGICRTLLGQNDARVQAFMTPAWVGLLGWIHTALIVVVTAILWFAYGWPFGVGALVYSFVGMAIVDAVSPLPTYGFCFRLIERELESRMKADTSGEVARFRAQIAAVKAKFGVQ